ncbi:MAG: DUF2277 domain-containing protein [Actinobacteria bacterium]|nr:DUF2277 domain-containing protein [Actinomycetota bacterium]
MCRNIQTLRPPFVEHVTSEDMHAAALQYVRKISGMRAPSKANVEAFESAVAAVTEATQQLLDQLVVKPSTSKNGKEFANHTSHARARAEREHEMAHAEGRAHSH